MSTAASEIPARPFGVPEIVEAARVLGASGGGTGAAQLLGLLYDDNVDADEVLRHLNAEPALAARILKIANSPFYRSMGTVGTLERAVQVLGLAAVRGIAAAGCMDRLPLPASGRPFDAAQFRRHSLAVALSAQELSRRQCCGVDGEAFMAGLLHDIGLVLLARLRPQALADAAHAGALELDDVASGIDHAECAAILAQTWALPAWMVAALRDHHRPTPATAGLEALPALLALGDRVAADAGYALGACAPRDGQDGAPVALDPGDESLQDLASRLPSLMQAFDVPPARA